LSHHHEVMPALYQNIALFNSTLVTHQNTANYLKQPIDDVYWVHQRDHIGSLSIIPTPGHTNTNLCYYYVSPHGKAYLFTGDTIYREYDQWSYLIMTHEGGSKAALKNSLESLKQLHVDVLLPSVALGTNRSVEVSQSEWHTIVDQLIVSLSS